MSIGNTSSVDIESVLNICRRTLASVGKSALPRRQPHDTDTIYVKREDNSNSILSVNSKIFISGELQLLHKIFQRYASDIIIHEESIETNSLAPISSNKPNFSATRGDEHDKEDPPIVSTLL